MLFSTLTCVCTLIRCEWMCVFWYGRRKWQWKPSNFHRVNTASTSLDVGNMLENNFIIISHTYHKRHSNDIQCSCFTFSGLDNAVLRWVRRRVCRLFFFFCMCAMAFWPLNKLPNWNHFYSYKTCSWDEFAGHRVTFLSGVTAFWMPSMCCDCMSMEML